MRKRPARIRSGPFYVQAGDEVISLVAEAEIRPTRYDISHKFNSTEVARPIVVHVIDKNGVYPVAVRAGRSIPIPALFFGTVLMPLQYVLSAWWKRRRG